MTGFSTHVNVAMPDDEVVSLGRVFAESCLAAMADVMEPEPSSGIFVRPRRARLEVGGEYVEGRDLCAALTLMAACVETLRSGQRPPVVPPPGLSPSREKFGWYASTLPVGQLRPVWEWARPAAIARGIDPAPVDELASEHRLLRRFRSDDFAQCTFGGEPDPTSTLPDVGLRVLPSGVMAETEWLTWDHVVWLFEDSRGRRCRAVVSAADEQQFLTDVEAGAYDDVLRRMLRRWVRTTKLHRNAQLHGLTWWHELRPAALVPAERLHDGSVPAAFSPPPR
jgi:hypothetical protein